VDAGLAAASVGDRPKGMLIQFALEPLMAVMEDRDADLIRTYGNRSYAKQMARKVAGAAVTVALSLPWPAKARSRSPP
jgi:hypothetical protein